MSRSTLYPFSCFRKSDNSPISFPQLKNFNLVLNSEKSEQIPSGLIDVACTYLANAKPMANFTTHDLLTFFTVCGPASVLPITAAVARMIQRQEDGDFLNVGDTYEFPKATIVPTSLGAAQEDVDGATLQFGVYILTDGVNEAIGRGTAVDFTGASGGVAAPVPACASKYFMGPATLGGLQIPNVEKHGIEFGINYNAKGFNGSVYPTEGSIVSRRPSISITTTALNFDATRNMFISSLGGPLTLYFQRAIDGDDRAAGNVPTHLAITAAAGSICSEDVSSSENDDGTLTLKATPHGPLSVNLAATLP